MALVYLDRRLNPIDRDVWRDRFLDRRYRVVKETGDKKDRYIRTVWVGVFLTNRELKARPFYVEVMQGGDRPKLLTDQWCEDEEAALRLHKAWAGEFLG